MRRIVVLLGLVAGCTGMPGQDGTQPGELGGKGDSANTASSAGPGRSIAETQLELDLTTLRATAHIKFEAGGEQSSRLALSHLLGGEIIDSNGTAKIVGDEIVVEGLPASAAQLAVRYTLPVGGAYNVKDMYRYSAGTYTWPNHCGDLFPCHSLPVDGTAFSLQLTGVPAGMTAVYPDTISEAPSYQLAWAVGKYRYLSAGKTDAGTEVGFYTLQDQESDTNLAPYAALLAKAFDHNEKTYGPYRFGSRVASVEVDTLPGFSAGQEHHPFWHLGGGDMWSAEVHIHEATHGWFGDGIRLRCWEDLVLSEGVTTYITMRTRIAIGDMPESDGWTILAENSNSIMQSGVAAWPQGCSDLGGSFEADGSPHIEAYYRGAQFMREIARAIGPDKLDLALAEFYRARGGAAAGVSDLIASIRTSTGFDANALADTWLRAGTTPQAMP